MAQTLQGINRPARITLSGTTVNLLTLPDGTEYITVRPIATDAFLTVGVADADSKGDHYKTLPYEIDTTIAIKGGGYGLSGTASAVVEVTPHTRGL